MEPRGCMHQAVDRRIFHGSPEAEEKKKKTRDVGGVASLAKSLLARARPRLPGRFATAHHTIPSGNVQKPANQRAFPPASFLLCSGASPPEAFLARRPALLPMSVASVAALRTAGSGRCRGAGSPQVGLNGGRFLMMQRRELVTKAGIALAVSCSMATSPASANGSAQGLEILPFKPDGYNFWTWRGRRIHYVEQGAGQPIVLIHGFGASAFHWRYNIPELAKKYKVYAIDLLGFGWSEKALVDYEATIWMEQVADFLREIVKEPAVLVGNSLGGFTTLFTATEVPELTRGVVLLNSAGQFADPNKPAAAPAEEEEGSPLSRFIVKPLKEAFQRVVLGFLFWQSKQPARVEKVLKSVYIDSSNVDEYLIGSITAPTADPNAGEVYYRLMSRFMSNQSRYTLDRLLGKMSCPLLLLWGDLDPWVGPAKAARIQEFYADTTVVHLQAGHCPHDEAPEQANRALLEWLAALDARAKPAEPTLQTV